MRGEIKVMIIDGDPTRRSLIRSALGRSVFRVVGEAHDIAAALALETQPDAVVIGDDIPDVQTVINAAYPQARIIELSTLDTHKKRIRAKKKLATG